MGGVGQEVGKGNRGEGGEIRRVGQEIGGPTQETGKARAGGRGLGSRKSYWGEGGVLGIRHNWSGRGGDGEARGEALHLVRRVSPPEDSRERCRGMRSVG